jgi:hypothetical protein
VEYDENNNPIKVEEGLLIWHIDTSMANNTKQEMTPKSHYMISVEQADGMFHLEKKETKDGGVGDLFHEGYVPSFGPNIPSDKVNSNMWNGSPSGLYITNISDVGDVMTFTYAYLEPLKAIPANLKCTSQTYDAVTLQWDGSTDNTAVYLFCVYTDTTSPEGVTRRYTVRTKDNSFTAQTRPGYKYTYVVSAIDDWGYELGTTNKLDISGVGNDTQKPTAPSNLSYSVEEDNSVKFTWDPSTDNTGEIRYYYINYTCEGQVDQLSVLVTTNYKIMKIQQNVEYTVYVTATDKFGNISPCSNTITVKIPDTQ